MLRISFKRVVNGQSERRLFEYEGEIIPAYIAEGDTEEDHQAYKQICERNGEARAALIEELAPEGWVPAIG